MYYYRPTNQPHQPELKYSYLPTNQSLTSVKIYNFGLSSVSDDRKQACAHHRTKENLKDAKTTHNLNREHLGRILFNFHEDILERQKNETSVTS